MATGRTISSSNRRVAQVRQRADTSAAREQPVDQQRRSDGVSTLEFNLDGGISDEILATDERGRVRVGRCDIGAAERGG